MKACREFRRDLEWLAAGELAPARRPVLEKHLGSCPACRRELEAWRSLLAEAAIPAAELEAAAAAVDWPAVGDRILAAAQRRRLVVRRPGPVASPSRLAAAAALAAVVGLGLFFLGRSTAPVPDPAAREGVAAAVLHLQSGLARAEAISYLQQSQLMFADLLKDCPSGEMAARELSLYSRKAKELLLRKKFIEQSLPPVEWLKVRPVSERIDWLNYEILQLGEQELCGQIQRLQRLLESERLLLKIRLLERELSSRPYIEA
jgi:hypothetical protein